MVDKKDATKEGSTLEHRRQGALKALKRQWQIVQNFSANTLLFKEDRAKKPDLLYALYLEQGGDTQTCPNKESLLKWLDGKDEELLAELWRLGLRSARRFYGPEAVEFALSELKKEQIGN